jgi:hypothetical protein
MFDIPTLVEVSVGWFSKRVDPGRIQFVQSLEPIITAYFAAWEAALKPTAGWGGRDALLAHPRPQSILPYPKDVIELRLRQWLVALADLDIREAIEKILKKTAGPSMDDSYRNVLAAYESLSLFVPDEDAKVYRRALEPVLRGDESLEHFIERLCKATEEIVDHKFGHGGSVDTDLHRAAQVVTSANEERARLIKDLRALLGR